MGESFLESQLVCCQHSIRQKKWTRGHENNFYFVLGNSLKANLFFITFYVKLIIVLFQNTLFSSQRFKSLIFVIHVFQELNWIIINGITNK